MDQLQATEPLSEVFDAMVLAMAALAEPGEAGNHIVRTQHYVRALAMRLKSAPAYAQTMTDAFVATLFRAAPLHDVGNAGVPDRILLKPGALSSDELDIVKTHPSIGRKTIEKIQRTAGVPLELLDVARDIAYSHQERWDGSGYPQGLAGDAIPLAARVMAIADSYDALTTRRVYREGVSHDVAVQRIFQQRSAHFDPDMVDAFIEIQHEFVEIAKRYTDTESDFEAKIDYMVKAIAETP